ncbi:MAG: hypothetical protein E7170_03245 [Firmicutes bacterium]|nr:hypothetical protein [Bacillota bacterium]
MFILDTVSCGGSMITMDATIPRLVTLIINLIKIVVPILLVIFGMLDLGKAVMAQKEDEIKKGQQLFIKRLIAAVLVFLVVFVVQLVVGLVAPDSEDADGNIWDCFECLIDYEDGNNCDPA